MFDSVLNIPLHYLRCFAVVLKGIHGNIDICQTDYSIPSKLDFSSNSEVLHGSTTFKLKNGQIKVKNDQLFNLMILFFHFLHFSVPDDKCHNQKWCVLFFTRIRLSLSKCPPVTRLPCYLNRNVMAFSSLEKSVMYHQKGNIYYHR